jgi:hydrogenase maturation factor HypF (carbamoyltransferase family)
LVPIEVEGVPPQLGRFLDEVSHHSPRLAHAEDLSWELRPPKGDRESRVDESLKDDSRYLRIAPDVATCVASRSELSDPRNRLLEAVDSRTTP